MIRKNSPHTPKGRLSIKLISARHLASPSTASRPYVVVTFDQNEFVSREPIDEMDAEIMGVPSQKEGENQHHHHLPQQQSPTPPPRGSTPPLILPLGSTPIQSPASTTATLLVRPSIHLNGVINGSGHSTSGIGRALDAYRNSKLDSTPLSPATTPTLESTPRSSHSTTTTSNPMFPTLSESTNATKGHQLSAHNPTWKHEVILYASFSFYSLALLLVLNPAVSFIVM